MKEGPANNQCDLYDSESCDLNEIAEFGFGTVEEMRAEPLTALEKESKPKTDRAKGWGETAGIDIWSEMREDNEDSLD